MRARPRARAPSSISPMTTLRSTSPRGSTTRVPIRSWRVWLGAIRGRTLTAFRYLSTPTTTSVVVTTSASARPARCTTARSSTTTGTTTRGTACGRGRSPATRRGGPRRCAFPTHSCVSSSAASMCGASISAATSPAKTSSISSPSRRRTGAASCRGFRIWWGSRASSRRAAFTRRPAADPFNDGSKVDPGFGADARIGLGSNLTLNATVNPDFGQVEVDPAVVNLSDRETFFNERRPFFVEGSSIFEFGYGGQSNFWGFNWSGPNFLYSRRIGRSLSLPGAPDKGYVDGPDGAHVLGALKLTGKVGGLTAITRRERATLQDSLGARWGQEMEPLTMYGVYRAQKEFDKGRQGLGFISTIAGRAFDDPTLRDARNGNAMTFGTDGWIFLDSSKTWVSTAWVAASRITGSPARLTAVQRNSVHYFQRPDAPSVGVDSSATSLTGTAARFTLAKQRGNTFVNSAFGVISPGFDVNDVGFLSRVGYINMHVGGGRNWTKPGKVFRYAETGGALFRNYDWDGNINWSGGFNFGYVQFKNYYWFNWNLAYNPWTVDNRRTRGGPLVLLPPAYQFGVDMGSDSRKSLTLGMGAFTYFRSSQDVEWSTYVNVQFRPAPNVLLSVGPNLYKQNNPLQYVAAVADTTGGASSTYNTHYVFGLLNQTELSAGIRLNWTYTPKLSLQLYAQPLISAGRYDYYQELARPRSAAFTRYGRDNGSTIAYVDSTKSYDVDPDGSGPARGFSFSKPDFNFKSLRGNAVLRWEYMPGSTLYFVWTQSRSTADDNGDFRFGRSMGSMLRAPAENIFMIKATYWWNP